MGAASEKTMKAVTLRQPWASLVLEGLMDVINLGEPTDFRGPLLIHAGRKVDRWSYPLIKRFGSLPRRLSGMLPLGQVIGVVEVLDCVDHLGTKSRWFNGPYALILDFKTNPIRHPPRPVRHFRCSGSLGLWDCQYPYLESEGLAEPPTPPIEVSVDPDGQQRFF